MKIDKQIILDTILSNKAVADALSVKKVYVYGINEPDVWRLLDVEEACIAPWGIGSNQISLNDSKVRVIYKVLVKSIDPIFKHLNGEKLKCEPYLYFSYGCGCFPTREECLEFGTPFVGHRNDGLEGISFDVSEEMQKVMSLFPEKLGYVLGRELEFHPLKDVFLYTMNDHEIMRITPWNYETGVLGPEVYPSSSLRTVYNPYSISNRILGVDDILVNFVMGTSGWKSESGDYDGLVNETLMDADELWRSVEEYKEHNESIKQEYRNRQRFID